MVAILWHALCIKDWCQPNNRYEQPIRICIRYVSSLGRKGPRHPRVRSLRCLRFRGGLVDLSVRRRLSLRRDSTERLEQNSVNTDDQQEGSAIFLQRVIAAVSQLKARLQRNYERSYPGLEEIIRIVLDEEEGNAWKLSIFPHLLFPDLFEAHIQTLGLEQTHADYAGIWAEPIDVPRAVVATC